MVELIIKDIKILLFLQFLVVSGTFLYAYSLGYKKAKNERWHPLQNYVEIEKVG